MKIKKLVNIFIITKNNQKQRASRMPDLIYKILNRTGYLHLAATMADRKAISRMEKLRIPRAAVRTKK